MLERFLTRSIVASLLIPVGMTLGCDLKSPSAPGRTAAGQLATPQPPASGALSLAAIYPRIGATGGRTFVTITGIGFESGAIVTLDGAPASATVNSSGQIVAETPAHAPGSVDVVVTNPGGQSGRLTRAFTYAVFTLTVSQNTVTAGGQLSVTWAAPGGGTWDWVAIFKVGASNQSYGLFEYTNGATSGTLTLSAPSEAGQYEFRYLLDDDFVDVVRSSPVTVN